VPTDATGIKTAFSLGCAGRRRRDRGFAFLGIRLENVFAQGDDPGDAAHADLVLAASDGQDGDGPKEAQTEEDLRSNLPDELGQVFHDASYYGGLMLTSTLSTIEAVL